MEFDDILIDHIGEFGWYQAGLLCLRILVTFPLAWHVMGMVFLSGVPDHWCSVNQLNDLNVTLDTILNVSIPWEEKDGQIRRSQCRVFDRNYDNVTEADVTQWLSQTNRSLTPNRKCQSWTYDSSEYTNTITTEWDLVCDNKWMHATASSVFMAGLLVGVLVFGNLSDWIGRRKSCLLSLTGLFVSAMATTFAPSYVAFIILRFFVAVFAMSTYTTLFVLSTEVIGPSWRLFSMSGGYFWAIGQMSVAGMAYLIRDWFKLQLAISIPIVLFFTYFCIMPESPRWLLAKGRTEEAKVIVDRMAYFNKKTAPENLDKFKTPDKGDAKTPTIMDLLRTPNMRKKSLIMFSNWFVCSLVYYGLSLNTSNLGGDDYVNFLISAAVELPANLVMQLSLLKLGRRWLLAGSEVLGGVALLCTLALPTGATTQLIVLSMSGKFFMSISFGIVYLYSVELFPTVVRNVGVGTSSSFARFGGILAPYISLLSDVSRFAPTIVFGCFSLIAGLTALLLPETKDQKLPETLEEGELFGKKLNAVVKMETKEKEMGNPVSFGNTNPAFDNSP